MGVGDHFERARTALLVAFKAYARGLPGVRRIDVENDQEWWALGRHFGLETPLLDWTRSPYVAAFFAWADYLTVQSGGQDWTIADRPVLYGPPIVIWELAGPDKLLVDGEFELLTSGADVAHRQKAQQGLFTILRHTVHLDLESYLASRGFANRLVEYEIDGSEVFTAMADLALMNIGYGTLFPDFEGAALQANTDMALQATTVGFLTASRRNGSWEKLVKLHTPSSNEQPQDDHLATEKGQVDEPLAEGSSQPGSPHRSRVNARK